MAAYKDVLADRLLKAVKEQFPEAECVLYQKSDEGFYGDYAIAPLVPAVFEKIRQCFVSGADADTFDLGAYSGVYEGGKAENRMLQRIYVLAFETAGELEAHHAFVKEAAKADHKTLGHELKLFSNAGDIGQGLTLWHPKGAMVRYLLESFAQKAHLLNGYEWVYTPHIGRAELWQTSGHLEFYRDTMYSPIVIDQQAYYLKPMNCPFHISIYNSDIHSYRELPIKYAEFGTVYRYELSGTLNGLTRVRGFTQDDAHIFCTPEQVEKEVTDALAFSLYILRSFGLDRFQAYISTRPKNKSIGEDSDWEMAIEVLKKAVIAAGLDYQIDEGGGAFYGPKIDIKLFDALNRPWQCSTIQFDFNLPARFNVFYVGRDGQHHTPYMVHRALFGSLERFMALLIEHYKGDFPLWLAPVQLGIVPIKQAHNAYARKLAKLLKAAGFRVKADEGDEPMRQKIKRFELDKVPYVLVVGDKEIQSEVFCVRSRKDGNVGEMDIMSLCAYVKPQLDLGIPRCVVEDD